jgi:hypothetical protein
MFVADRASLSRAPKIFASYRKITIFLSVEVIERTPLINDWSHRQAPIFSKVKSLATELTPKGHIAKAGILDQKVKASPQYPKN